MKKIDFTLGLPCNSYNIQLTNFKFCIFGLVRFMCDISIISDYCFCTVIAIILLLISFCYWYHSVIDIILLLLSISFSYCDQSVIVIILLLLSICYCYHSVIAIILLLISFSYCYKSVFVIILLLLSFCYCYQLWYSKKWSHWAASIINY